MKILGADATHMRRFLAGLAQLISRKGRRERWAVHQCRIALEEGHLIELRVIELAQPTPGKPVIRYDRIRQRG